MTEFGRNLLEKIKHGRCEVLGLGVSNLPLCRFLVENGAKNVYGRDRKSEESFLQAANELKEMGVTLLTGNDYLEGIGGEEPENTFIFRSPGIKPSLQQIREAVERGAVLSSEMEMFLELTCCENIIGVTGSDGKTTTTTLIGKLLEEQIKLDKSSRRVFVGGNIGEPLLPRLDEIGKDDFVVVELSSFQLMTMRRSVGRAVVTNLTPNHLDWHPNMDEYRDAKANLFMHEPCRHLTVNAEDATTRLFGESFGGSVTFFSSERKPEGKAVFLRDDSIVFSDDCGEEILLDVSSIIIPGMYNVQNYMAAISATRPFVSKEAIRNVAESFVGVEHRCEFVREKDGVRYYNSSIDSSPTRTAAALSVFDNRVVVICGGYDKNIPFEPLALTLCKRAKTVVLTGATATKIREAILSCPNYRPELFDILERSDFTEAVIAASGAAEKGDAVVLSPACASFGTFENFIERGRRFKEIINNL